MNKKNIDCEKNAFTQFCQTVSRLRSEDGCPWDRKQDGHSLRKYIREECDELLEAMEGGDSSHLCEEMGDLLFLLVLLAEINSEKDLFSMDDVLCGINEKMVRRHPHVFADKPVGSEEELKEQWEKIKSQELRKKIN
ncbi:MAG: MazG nucleotide pyrophosphohydrolase domain-containing protein [Thermodesulfobacteriota bacterium]